MGLLLSYYKTILNQTSCGNSRGVKVLAKPLFILALIESIERGKFIGNKLTFIPKEVEEIYKEICVRYNGYRKATHIELPFFHLNKEPYFHLKFVSGIIPPPQAQSPSRAYLRDNIEYAYLDPNLWDLLQDSASREELKTALIDHFFSK